MYVSKAGRFNSRPQDKKKGAGTMLKNIVEEIAKGKPIDEVCGMIDRAYQNDKISWKDHETLYALIGRIDK